MNKAIAENINWVIVGAVPPNDQKDENAWKKHFRYFSENDEDVYSEYIEEFMRWKNELLSAEWHLDSEKDVMFVVFSDNSVLTLSDTWEEGLEVLDSFQSIEELKKDGGQKMKFEKCLDVIKSHGGSNNAMITVPGFTTRYTRGINSKSTVERVWVCCRDGTIIDLDSHVMKNMTAGEVIDALRNAGVEFND